VLDDLAAGEFAMVARRWIGPFRDSFPDFTMEIADLIADSEKVAAHFRCSGIHLGEWTGHPPTGRRFHRIDERTGNSPAARTQHQRRAPQLPAGLPAKRQSGGQAPRRVTRTGESIGGISPADPVWGGA